MERKCNESVNNEFKIMRKRNSLHQKLRANNETNSPYSFLFNYFLIHYFDMINLLKLDKIHYI